MAQQLYTEEQVKNAFKKGYEKFFDDIESLEDFANEYLQTITPIELPTDEEIVKQFTIGVDVQTEYPHKIEGAKWVINKILNK